jgi:hypothetical protein
MSGIGRAAVLTCRALTSNKPSGLKQKTHTPMSGIGRAAVLTCRALTSNKPSGLKQFFYVVAN